MIKFEVSIYLSRKDLERTRFIKEAVMNSKNLHEILEYEKEMQRLIKKAYLKMLLEEDRYE